MAREERLGSWLVVVRTDARLDQLDAEILSIVRAMVRYGKKQLRPGSYTSDDLRLADAAWGRHGAKRFSDAHKRAKAQGIIELTGTDDRLDIVTVMPLSGVFEIVGFAGPLAQAIEDNNAKLGKARPRETHLAVAVNRYDASRFPQQTPVPSFPDELDQLWVIHRWHDHLRLPGVWSARRGAAAWIAHKD